MSAGEPIPASTPEERFRRSADVVDRSIAGQRLLVPVRGASADLRRVYLLNGTAAAAWDLLADPVTLTALSDELGRQYGEPGTAIRSDVEELLGELGGRDLIVREVPAG